MSLTSLTLKSTEGLEHVDVPWLQELSTNHIEHVPNSILSHLTSLMGIGADPLGRLHRCTELVTLTMTSDYDDFLSWSFDGLKLVTLTKLQSFSLRLLECTSNVVPDEPAYVVSVVKELNALMLEHPTLECLHICCQHDDDDDISKVFTLQIHNLSLAKYTKVDLQLCTDWHCFSCESLPGILHQHDCFFSVLGCSRNQCM